MRGAALGDHHEATGVSIEAVNYAWARLVTHAQRQVRNASEQSVYQCAATVPRRRVYHHPGRLIDYPGMIETMTQAHLLVVRSDPFANYG